MGMSKVKAFNPEKAKSFRENVLEKGGTEDPMVLYKRFRGAEPSIEPLLRKRGLDKKQETLKKSKRIKLSNSLNPIHSLT